MSGFFYKCEYPIKNTIWARCIVSFFSVFHFYTVWKITLKKTRKLSVFQCSEYCHRFKALKCKLK